MGATDHHRCTPLHIACSEGHPPVVRALIAWRASTTARDEHEWTPLMYACGVSDANHTPRHDEALLAVVQTDPARHFDVVREFIESHSQSKAELARNLCRRMAEVPSLFAALNDFLHANLHLLGTSFGFLLRRPGLLDIRNKRAWLRRQARTRSPPPSPAAAGSSSQLPARRACPPARVIAALRPSVAAQMVARRVEQETRGATDHLAPLVIRREAIWESFATWVRIHQRGC